MRPLSPLVRTTALLFLVVAGSIGSRANAATLVDTGVIPCTPQQCGALPFGTFVPDNKLAARFSLTEDSQITSIEAWVGKFANEGHSFTIALYAGDSIPDESIEYLAQSAFVAAGAEDDPGSNGFAGISGLSLVLQAGTYWLSLETRSGNDYDGYAPSNEWGALNPAESYAIFESGRGWFSYPQADLAFRIQGNPVPEPATCLLVGLGLAALVREARPQRRRRAEP